MEPELTPTSLGELLLRARIARGYTLEQVEQHTRIRRRFLEALESNDLAVLPPPVFTRGLVRAYAGFLGVDQIEAAELLNKEEARGESVGVRPTVSSSAALPAAHAGLPLRGIGAAVALALLGVAVGLTLPRYTTVLSPATAVAQSRSPGAEPLATPAPALQPTPPPRPTVAPTVAPTATPQPSPTLPPDAQASATAAAGQRGVTIDAKTSGRVWVQVEADGQVTFAGILQPGEHKVWRAERRLSLYVGDAGLVEVIYNGLAVGQIGPKGEVAKKEWLASR